MNIFENLLRHLNSIDDEIKKLKLEIKDCLTNKDKYLLCDRWELFCKLPDYYSEHRGHIPGLSTFKKHGVDYSLYDDFYADRYSVIYIPDMIQSMIEEEIYLKKFKSLEEYLKFIDEFKEEVLQENLKSFKFDW